MKRKLLVSTCCLFCTMALVGCASDVSIFYPKTGAAKAADNVIDDIFGSPSSQNVPLANVSSEPAKK